MTVPVTGSVTIGSYTAAAPFAQGYTNSFIPGDICNGSGLTEFTFGIPAGPMGSYALPAGLVLLSYRDLILRDAFPSVPMPAVPADISFLASGGGQFEYIFQGRATLSAVNQSTPVPEPGTISLLALGLAAVVRRSRARVSP